MSVQHTPPNPTPKTSGNLSVNLSRRLAPGTIEHLRPPSSNPSSSQHTNKKRQASEDVEVINDGDSTDGAMSTDELVEILKNTIRQTLKEETENILKKMVQSAIREEISTITTNLADFATKLDDTITTQHTETNTALSDLLYVVDKVIRPKLDQQRTKENEKGKNQQEETPMDDPEENISTYKSTISDLQKRFLQCNRQLKQKLNENLSTFNKNDKRANLSDEEFEEIKQIRPQMERWYRHSQALEKHIHQEEQGHTLSTYTQSHISITHRQTIIPKEHYKKITQQLQEQADRVNLQIIINDLELTLDMIKKLDDELETLNDFKKAKLWGIVTRKYNELSDRNIRTRPQHHEPEPYRPEIHRQQQEPQRRKQYHGQQQLQHTRTPRSPNNIPDTRKSRWQTRRMEPQSSHREDNYNENFPPLPRNYRNEQRTTREYNNDHHYNEGNSYLNDQHQQPYYNYREENHQDHYRDEGRRPYQEPYREERRRVNPDPYPYYLN